ncbi:MAG: LysR family transcriptional regulator [Bacteroidota bacterium]|jgi:molybdate transport system regulatory protein
MAGPKGSKYYDVFLDYSIILRQRNTNEPILTQEQLLLFLNIDELESIAASAKKMDISYRKAWELVRRAEDDLGFALVCKSRGGSEGGKSELTPDGKQLVEAYRQLRSEFDDSVKRVVKNFFQTINR